MSFQSDTPARNGRVTPPLSRASRALFLFPVLALLLAALPLRAFAAELADCRKAFQKGDYKQAIDLAKKAVEDREREEEWRVLLAKSLLATGRYPEATNAISSALERFPISIQIRVVGREVYLSNGQKAVAQSMLDEINELGGNRRWGFREPATVVALGRAALLLGADPKLVLDNFFEPAKKTDPKFREVYLAIGELALQKQDFALAAKNYQASLKLFPDDPDIQFGLAEAFSMSDRAESSKALAAVFEANPNHVPALLLQADHAIDAEDYSAAESIVESVRKINPHHPEAWAALAVVRHLRGDFAGEKQARDTALKFWATNPRVDFLIGQKLSQKYRFAEGAAYQRQAIAFDAEYLPAKMQLAQDLLRLGEEKEGWSLAESVHKADQYNVLAFNLATLQDSVLKFQTVTNRDFILRMAPSEMAVYGQDVLEHVGKAKEVLGAKYGIELTEPTTVEIFPEQRDFAVRTFGMPGGEGYLGVCFGHVITANSPASQTANPSNWKAMLWHEFCHVITLQLTKNKMPRWLSEGISVYEEIQANPTWGQAMNPKYREFIVKGEAKPIGKLSMAFMTAPSPLHLQFAYYQSYLAVDFLIAKHGVENLKKILRDLGEGKEINAAIEAHTMPLEKLDKEYLAHLKEMAEQFAPGLDWEKPKTGGGEAFAEGWEAVHPTNYYVLNKKAMELASDKKWAEAKKPLLLLVELYPEQIGAGNAYTLLAKAHHALGETNEEKSVLMRLAAREADDLPAFSRLLEISSGEKDWKNAASYAERALAVNPLREGIHEKLARAKVELGDAPRGIKAYQTALLLSPADPVGIHYELAKLVAPRDAAEAKRHLLQALEEAPRFREAHRMLLQMVAKPPAETPPPAKVEEPAANSALPEKLAK